MKRLALAIAGIGICAGIAFGLDVYSGINNGTLDATYLRLDTTNDPVADDLEIEGDLTAEEGTFKKDQNNTTSITLRNDTNGTSARSKLIITAGDESSGGAYMSIESHPDLYTLGTGLIKTSSAIFITGGNIPGGLFMYTMSDDPVIFGQAGAETLRFDTDSLVTLGSIIRKSTYTLATGNMDFYNNVSAAGDLSVDDISADEISGSSATLVHGIITGKVAISTDTQFQSRGLGIYAADSGSSARSVFTIQSALNYGIFSIINYGSGSQGLCFDCDKIDAGWGEDSRNVTSNFMIYNSEGRMKFRAASGVALDADLSTEWKEAFTIDKTGDVYMGYGTANPSTHTYTTGNQAVKSLTVADNSILGGVNFIGKKTTGEIQAYSCTGHATNPCVIYNSTNNDLYTSTGTAISQFKSQLDGSGL